MGKTALIQFRPSPAPIQTGPAYSVAVTSQLNSSRISCPTLHLICLALFASALTKNNRTVRCSRRGFSPNLPSVLNVPSSLHAPVLHRSTRSSATPSNATWHSNQANVNLAQPRSRSLPLQSSARYPLILNRLGIDHRPLLSFSYPQRALIADLWGALLPFLYLCAHRPVSVFAVAVALHARRGTQLSRPAHPRMDHGFHSGPST